MKAILVIDMPNNCMECPLFREEFTLCPNIEKPLDEGKPNWCPLRPLPQKTSGHGKTYCMVNSRVSSIPAYGEYDRGWNDCIDAITGETE